MKPIPHRYLEILTAICNLPTAPYCEHHVIAWLLDWAKSHPEIRVRRDKAANVYLHYRRGRAARIPLVIEAHMDHPGFVVVSQRGTTVKAEFRGGVRPSHFENTRAKFWLPSHGWIPAKVHSIKKPKKGFLQVTLTLTLTGVKTKLPRNTLGMWDLPDVAKKGELLTSRVFDDLGGIAAIICMLEELISQKIEAHVICLCSRAEEVGFAGVIAACENNWIPRKAAVIGLETSKALPHAPQGNGPIIRVGDKTGLFSPGLTHFITQSAGHLADEAPAKDPFKFQRKLMDGGTCNSTAFMAWGYDAAAMCVPLGNYHNMTIKGDAGWGDGTKTGKGIASETIHAQDFAGMVAILVETARRMPNYQPGFGFMRERLSKLHREDHAKLLYAKSTAPRAKS